MCGPRAMSVALTALGAVGMLALGLLGVAGLDAITFHTLPPAGRIAAAAAAAFVVCCVGRGVLTALRMRRRARRWEASRQVVGTVDWRGKAVGVYVGDRPEACCVGLLRPRVLVSCGARRELSPAQLDAVLAHEHVHRARRDPLRLLLAGATAQALGFLPGAARTEARYRALLELAADGQATQVTSRPALAGALLAFSDVGAVPAERVDGLLGQAPRLRLPAVAVALDAAILTAAIAVTAALVLSTGCTAGLIGDEGCSSSGASGAAVVAAVLAGLVALAAGAVRGHPWR